jgi:hypothetical protein
MMSERLPKLNIDTVIACEGVGQLWLLRSSRAMPSVTPYDPTMIGRNTSIDLWPSKMQRYATERGSSSTLSSLVYQPQQRLCFLKIRRCRNHETAFWALIGQVLPDWQARQNWRDKNEHMLG